MRSLDFNDCNSCILDVLKLKCNLVIWHLGLLWQTDWWKLLPSMRFSNIILLALQFLIFVINMHGLSIPFASFWRRLASCSLRASMTLALFIPESPFIRWHSHMLLFLYEWKPPPSAVRASTVREFPMLITAMCSWWEIAQWEAMNGFLPSGQQKIEPNLLLRVKILK